MRYSRPLAGLAWTALLLSGCTKFESKPYVGANSPVIGIRLPEQRPLLVVKNGDVSVVMVPNPDRGVALNFSAFLAKHSVTLKFQNGVLTELTSDQDSTEVAKALVPLAQDLVKALSGDTPPGGSGGKFQVYAVNFGNDGNISGLKPLVMSNEMLDLSASATNQTPIVAVGQDGKPAPGDKGTKPVAVGPDGKPIVTPPAKDAGKKK